MTHEAHVAIDLVGFLMLGLLGSAGHCVGMCAPFVMVVSRQYERPAGRHSILSAQAWYSAGRITTYAVLGALAGALGLAIERAGAFAGLQRAAAILAGGALVAWALLAWVGSRQADVGGALFARIVRVVKGRIPPHPYLIGLMLGLLPCGFLYAAVIAAVGRGSALGGAEAMLAFGLGTVPALMTLALADRRLASRLPGAQQLAQLFVLVMGAWYLWRAI